MEIYKNNNENAIDKDRLPKMKPLGSFTIGGVGYNFYVSEECDDQALYLMIAKLNGRIVYYGYARYRLDPDYCIMDFYKNIIDSKIHDIKVKSKILKDMSKHKVYYKRLLEEGDKLEDEYRHAVHMSMMHVINWMDN